MDKNIDVIENVYQTLKSINSHMEKKYPDKKWLTDPVVKYFELVHEGVAEGKPLLWYFFCLPPEIFRAMDVTTFSAEYACGVMASLGDISLKYFDLANVKIPDHVCTVNIFPVGLVSSGETLTPDLFLAGAQNPCDSAITAYSNLAYCDGIPSFFLDIPYIANDRAYKYVGKQFEAMVAFVEEQTGQRLDMDRLREVIRHSNKAQQYFLKLNDLRRNIPSPSSSRGLYIAGGAMMGLAGIPEFTEWIKNRYEAAKEMVEKGEGAIPEEKVRLVWIANGVDFDLGIFEWLENKFGAVTVASLLNAYPSEPLCDSEDESEIFKSLAHRIMNYPMGRHGRGSADFYIEECIRVAEDYKADAVIFAGNVGCKWNWAVAQLVKNSIQDALGIPTLAIQLDPWDPRFVSLDVIKEKFAQFFELML
ncbi:MAG: 2-hydroxyacyl-CoA dehydratase family protein [Desulfatiglans sp.]|jgi:benzoyl-CoA reductase/2-hydroxyglutaryl-CoA dehydratase subunit BcrC/BadD/HgdB|nr:2-hydroxyacyl-CoA dehydratase family protein [Desulfatiglans sp.]